MTAAANPMPDPFTPPGGFVPTGVSQRQLDAAAEYKPDPLEEFFASGFSQRQLDALAEHAGFYLRHGLVPGLQVVADAIDRARDLPWREAHAATPAAPSCPRCGALRALDTKWGICPPCVLLEGWNEEDQR